MAISVTVNSIKIDITSTGGVEETFDSVVTAVNSVSAGTITGTGTSGDPYVVTGDREIEISTNCIVRFVADTYLEWNSITTSGRVALDCASASIVNVEEGCHFTFDGSAAQIYVSFYGEINLSGTTSKHIVLERMSRIYMYIRSASIWEYFEINDNRVASAGGYCLYFSNFSGSNQAPTIILRNFSMSSSTNYGLGFYFTPGGIYSNFDIHDFVIDGLYVGAYLYGCSVKLYDGVIKNCVSYAIQAYGVGNVVSAEYDTSHDDNTFPTGRFQSMGVLENITFQDNNTTWAILNYYNSLLQVKDCTFIDTGAGTKDGIYTTYGSVLLEYNNTYTNMGTEKGMTQNGSILKTRKFDITVQDESSNPIKDATVTWVQGSTPSKERWPATTNSDGKVLNMYGGSPILVESEETTIGVFSPWSNDTGNGLCHYLTVSKYGYDTYQSIYNITQDYDITVTLYLSGSTSGGGGLPDKPEFKFITHKKIKGV